MIPLHAVTTAVLTMLRTAAPAGTEVGDGEPPELATDRAHGWLLRLNAPATQQGFMADEEHRFVRYRVTSEATDTGQTGRAARVAAELLADTFRTALLTGTRPSGTGWRCTAIRHDATATVHANRAVAVHDDYILHIAAT